MGEVRSFAGAAIVAVGAGVGGNGSGVDVSGAATVGVLDIAAEGEADRGVAGGATGIGWQAALRQVRMSRQGRSFVVIDIHYPH